MAHQLSSDEEHFNRIAYQYNGCCLGHVGEIELGAPVNQ